MPYLAVLEQPEAIIEGIPLVIVVGIIIMGKVEAMSGVARRFEVVVPWMSEQNTN